MTVDAIPVWMDCDPGTDDAFAILLALFHPRFKLLGISTVHGNTTIENTTRNALGLLEVLKIDNVPVYRGTDVPLVKPPIFAHYAHGPGGMGGGDLPDVSKLKAATDKSYLEAIRDAILEHEGEICIVAIGPTTNISVLFSTYPDLRSKIKFLPIMGGAFGLGNATPYSEFNVFEDPKAGNDILTDEILMNKVVVAGLNITHLAVADDAIRKKLFDGPNKGPVATRFENIMNFFYTKIYKSIGWPGPPLHDPLAVYLLLPLIDPEGDYGFKYFRRRTRVIQEGDHEGETVFVNGSVFEDEGSEETGSIIGVGIDVPKFYDFLGEALINADLHVAGK